MAIRFRIPVLALGAWAAVGCGGGKGPTGPSSAGHGFTARLDGQTWAADSATIRAQALVGVAGGILIVGSRTQAGSLSSLSLTLGNISGPGTYPLGVGPLVYGGSGQVAEALVGSPGGNVWITPGSGVAGSITLATLGGGRIAGTFEFTADSGTGIAAGGSRSVTEGKIDLAFLGTLEPVPEHAGSRVRANCNGKPYQAWTATATLRDHLGGPGLQLVSSSTVNGVSILLSGVTAPGTFALSNPTRVLFAGLGGGSAANCCWGANALGDSGTVTVTTLTATRIRGTFSGTLQPQPGSPASVPLAVTDGEFDVGIPP